MNLRTAAAGLALALPTGLAPAAALAAPSQVSMPSADNSVQVCTNGLLDRTKLANFYYYNPNNAKNVAAVFKSPDDLLQAWRTRSGATPAQKAVLQQIASQLEGAFNRPGGDFRPATPGAMIVSEDFLAGTATGGVPSCPALAAATAGSGTVPAPGAPQPAPISPPGPVQPGPTLGARPQPTLPPTGLVAPTVAANPEAATPSPFAWLGNFRVRGIANDLLISRDNQSAYTNASGATLGYSDTGTTHTTNNALQAAVGYDFNFQTPHTFRQFDVIPYAAVDRSITTVSGRQSASSRENVSVGLTGAWTQPVGTIASNVLSGSYQHLWNDVDNSQINMLHLLDLPVVGGLINDYHDISLGPTIDTRLLSVKPIVNLVADVGSYSDLGLPSSKNRNYRQAGGLVGADFKIQPLNSDITVTQLSMHQFEKLRNDINEFIASFTYNISKDVGLKAGYTNGNIEATGQRIQTMTLSLTAKY